MAWWAGHGDGQASGSACTEEQGDGAGPRLHTLTPLFTSCSSQGRGQVAHTAPRKVTQRERQTSAR